MADHTLVNLKSEVENMAPKFGMGDALEARFGRNALELEHSGVSYFKAGPNYRLPFGHHHDEAEETYIVITGGASMKVGDEVIAMKPMDALRVGAKVVRQFEAGPDGAEIIVFGTGDTNKDVEMIQDWWTD